MNVVVALIADRASDRLIDVRLRSARDDLPNATETRTLLEELITLRSRKIRNSVRSIQEYRPNITVRDASRQRHLGSGVPQLPMPWTIMTNALTHWCAADQSIRHGAEPSATVPDARDGPPATAGPSTRGA